MTDRTSGRRPGAGPPRWLVLREGLNQRWGSELRRRQVFSRLAERTGATILEGDWLPTLLRRAARGPVLGRLPGSLVYRAPRFGRKPRLAASDKLGERLLEAAAEVTDPVAVAIYDDPVAHARALGFDRLSVSLEGLAERQRRNADQFRWLVAPTRSFAELAGLDLDRLIVGGNGTNVERIAVGPWPAEPTVGVVSGAAPGRGLELLIEAVRIARGRIPELRLALWLISTGDESEAYLRGLRDDVAGEPWVSFGTVPYDRLGATLATASMLCIPHPPGDYWDVALPVKIFDSLAAGRPLVITPRTETASLVRRHGAGVVADGDRAEDLASAIASLVLDPERMQRLGRQARVAATTEYDWPIVGDRIATAILEREAA